MILWVRLFLQAQGYTVTDNIIFQDNQSTMLLVKNGRQLSGKKTRHIEIHYYFITDHIKHGNASVAYCPTDDMVADFFMKLLQGSLFRKFHAIIMNLPSDPMSRSQEHVESSRCRNDDVICQPTDGNQSDPLTLPSAHLMFS
jgi:hypothetical protein